VGNGSTECSKDEGDIEGLELFGLLSKDECNCEDDAEDCKENTEGSITRRIPWNFQDHFWL